MHASSHDNPPPQCRGFLRLYRTLPPLLPGLPAQCCLRLPSVLIFKALPGPVPVPTPGATYVPHVLHSLMFPCPPLLQLMPLRTAENCFCLEQPVSKPAEDPEMRLPGGLFLFLFFSLAEVKLESSPNCFQFLLAVLPFLQGLSRGEGDGERLQLLFRAFL